tara:strand:- start:270 stop:848 length:579 start_codon:yes stop_codon:yes gene_type:complete
MTNLKPNHIVCTYSRPGGEKQHLAIVEISSPHDLAGYEIMLTLQPSQSWIRDLDQGDIVHVRNRLKPGDTVDFLSDPCPNANQPCYQAAMESRGTEMNGFVEQFTQGAPIQATIDEQLKTCPSASSLQPPLELEIKTYISDPELLPVFSRLSSYDTKKEAGKLLLEFALRNLRAFNEEMETPNLYRALTKKS